MSSAVRSYSKINLGLAIGPLRPDGFHSIVTLYQTLALHDVVTVSARPALTTRIQLTSNDPRVPRDPRNTAWKMVTKALDQLGLTASIHLHIQKNLPIQGGMGAGSANAAAALIGLEHELAGQAKLKISSNRRLQIAAEVGSDVPLFLLGGSVLGRDRGQQVQAVDDVTIDGDAEIACVVALPDGGVSTPQAFRDWDARLAAGSALDLHEPPTCANFEELSCTYASFFGYEALKAWSGPSAIPTDLIPAQPDSPEKLRGRSFEQLHPVSKSEYGDPFDLAGNSLLALVRTGIENDFETVVFPQYPKLREIKQLLMGTPNESSAAIYAALAGSGSALFGLYRSTTDAGAAQQRLQQHGINAIVTKTMPRPLYWSQMFAE